MGKTYRITEGDVWVFTYKNGLLSRFGHDLRLKCTDFEVNIRGASVWGRFSTTSIVVETAMRDGQPSDELSKADRDEIDRATAGTVLNTTKFPDAHYSGEVMPASESDTFALRGALELVGSTQPLDIGVTRSDGRIVGQADIVPSTWGVKPFSALMGALRVKDAVTIQFNIPDPESAFRESCR